MKISQNSDGRIILCEQYGSTGQEITYVKPPNQDRIQYVESVPEYKFVNFFKHVFLPKGYPDSVSNDYTAYQIWDTAQAFCSTITGTIATQAVLTGFGVGDAEATPLAATITWVLKDGSGHFGRIFFAWSHGTYLDSYSKKWRLFADVLNDFAMLIEMSLQYTRELTTVVLCITTTMKAIVGIVGGATRAALTQHQALRGNMADLSAKDSAQETAVNLIASFTALLFLGLGWGTWVIFVSMMYLHIVCNYMAVRAVCLHIFNAPRYLRTISIYLRHEVISTPCQVNSQEPVIFLYDTKLNITDEEMCGFKIFLGHQLKPLLNLYSHDYNTFNEVLKVYSEMNYMLLPDLSCRHMYVILREDASAEDILCSYFHAIALSIIICSRNFCPLDVIRQPIDGSPKPFAQLCQSMSGMDWSQRRLGNNENTSSFAYGPTPALLKIIDDIVQKEWIQFKEGLLQAGWIVDKHVLVTDEWRISQDITHYDGADITMTAQVAHGKHNLLKDVPELSKAENKTKKIPLNDNTDDGDDESLEQSNEKKTVNFNFQDEENENTKDQQ